MRVGIVGATGYAGSELLRLSAAHPDLDVVIATGDSNAGKRVSDHVPALGALFPDMTFAQTSDVLSTELDVVFLALPHGQSQKIVPDLVAKNIQVVDLGADFRLKDPQDYVTWYGEAHHAPELLKKSVFGLVERHRSELKGATLIAAPGCYPTASSLALGPFLDNKKIATKGIVVNALSLERLVQEELQQNVFNSHVSVATLKRTDSSTTVTHLRSSKNLAQNSFSLLTYFL